MTFTKPNMLLTLCALTLAGGLQSAGASIVASSTINLNNLNVQVFDQSGGTNIPQLTWTTQSGQAGTTAYTSTSPDFLTDLQSAQDFTTALTSNSSSIFSHGNAFRDANILQSNAQSDFGNSNFADGGAKNQGDFQLTGKGIALISLDWQVSVTGGIPGDPENSGRATAIMGGVFSDANGNTSMGDRVDINPFETGSETKSGIFRFIVVGDGLHLVSGNLYVESYAKTTVLSTVPIPAAAWLFGSGLAALFGFMKRKTANV